MALDYRACISRGLWTEDEATDDEQACLWITFGLWAGPFAEAVFVITARGIGRFGFSFVMD